MYLMIKLLIEFKYNKSINAVIIQHTYCSVELLSASKIILFSVMHFNLLTVLNKCNMDNFVNYLEMIDGHHS